MLRFFTSLSFLYALTIVILIVYGVAYYRDFTRSRQQRRLFPFAFFIISAACFGFLYSNIHAPLKLKTFSNLDHHFIQHDGFVVTGTLELGRSDTVNNTTPFNRFSFKKENGIVWVSSAYSEEPFYVSSENGYHILSACYPAMGHTISFRDKNFTASIVTKNDDQFALKIGNSEFQNDQKLKIGLTAWNLFRDNDSLINSFFYNNPDLVLFLKNVLLVRDNVSPKDSHRAKKGSGELKYFLSGRLFQNGITVNYDNKKLQITDQQFKSEIPDQSFFAWGIGFLNNNRNQFRVKYSGNDSFLILNRYPVAYPLTEENRNEWEPHYISKFLLSDTKDMQKIPAVFHEGFLFSSFSDDSVADFSPLLLSYHKGAGNDSLNLKAKWLNSFKEVELKNDQLLLPARSTKDYSWMFSIRNTFNWDFGNRVLRANTWQTILFGSLGLFFLLVFFSSIIRPAGKFSWIWQLLSCITLVMLTTRFFLYWRYKSFPPYEAMDLPSQQQLLSIGNFAIIVVAAVALAIIFGFDSIKSSYAFIRKNIARSLKKPYNESSGKENILDKLLAKILLAGFADKKVWFFSVWVLVLLISSTIAAASSFNPGTCRHLAIALAIIYFIFLFISYRHSPLVASAEKSWWKIGTGKTWDILISNPVKVLLSISLLAVFAFIDIGFAIVFLNFLLFNETFLCINYSIAGLSAGSNRNATLFGILGTAYLIAFILNLVYAPYIFKFLLGLPQSLYTVIYVLFAISIAYIVVRLLIHLPPSRRIKLGIITAILFFAGAFFLFPKERILDKAAMTRYRIDVLTMPVDKAIESAYKDGKTYEPVIRAAQNQWFINTFIYEGNNPAVNGAGFNLIAHAPQNKGAKYNAQATDLVASRFFIAEHGKWSVLLYVLLLLLPTTMLASFYKLYPDFTNRINNNYPTVTAGFSILNYLLISALLVILAATGRYIFFGQDLPFGSILSKQSILFPCIIILLAVSFFKKITPEHYANRKKIIPGTIIFSLLAVLLFIVKPSFNTNKEFNAPDLANDMDAYIQYRLQPVLDYIDTSAKTKRLSIAQKDQLFADSLRKMLLRGEVEEGNQFFTSEINAYARSGFSRHLDQRRMLYLDLYSGRPQLAVNDNYFRIEPPPHLQHLWTGNVFGDTTIYNVSLWSADDGSVITKRLTSFTNEPDISFNKDLRFSFRSANGENLFKELYLINKSASSLEIKFNDKKITLQKKDSIKIENPSLLTITNAGHEQVLSIEPDALMKNYYVNGSRFYMYPLGSRFIWARNFAEAVSSDYTANGQAKRNAFVSIDIELMDSLTAKISSMMTRDNSYEKGAEYGICIADGNGRIVSLSDFINGVQRPDPNDKTGFNNVIMGEDGFVSQSLLRKQIGNINLLRLNPGPGSTLKPIVFSAIASQLDIDWNNFSSTGFSEKQHYFGSEKVPEYDFEKNNGTISRVTDYLRYSDNYYHSNVLLLGSYPKQELKTLLAKNFVTQNPETGTDSYRLHWPYFNYNGREYWLDGFEHWPGYINGKANFGMDNSFASIGLQNNFNIYTRNADKSFDMFRSTYDSMLFMNSYNRSGFILPEYALFDQYGENVNHTIPYDLFLSCFRGHVKGSSQVMIPPTKMLEAFGRMVTQSKNYSLTLNPYATPVKFSPFDVDESIPYNTYLSIMRESVFEGMKEVLFKGTAAGLGSRLKNGDPYYYYAKTGTTGDDELNSKSKLFAIIISSKDITDPDFNFRKNKFYTIYFTSQNGPPKQNEAFQAEIIKFLEQSPVFKKYMMTNK